MYCIKSLVKVSQKICYLLQPKSFYYIVLQNGTLPTVQETYHILLKSSWILTKKCQDGFTVLVKVKNLILLIIWAEWRNYLWKYIGIDLLNLKISYVRAFNGRSFAEWRFFFTFNTEIKTESKMELLHSHLYTTIISKRLMLI